MIGLLLTTAVVLATPDAGVARVAAKDAPRAKDSPVTGLPAPTLQPSAKLPSGGSHQGQTACGACHATTSWTDVRFNHARTGFVLTGRHSSAPCKGCHVTDFSSPLPRTCGACHRDVHAGELGVRCEGCHDTTDWRSRFDVDAHRLTNFPLLGAHAALPCVECHAETRERRFARTAVDCQGCHQADALRTAASDKPVNHVLLGLDQQPCRECHGARSFTPARFPTHDSCFPITAGVHAGVACLDCHTTLGGGVTKRCGTGTAHCTGCHSNAGTGAAITFTDLQHAEGKAPGYVFSDRRCLECHFAVTP